MNNQIAKKFDTLSLLKFTLPSMIMMLFMALYQMVDAVFVSNFVSETALSALNIVYPLISFIIAVAVMLATGGSAVIAKKALPKYSTIFSIAVSLRSTKKP